MVIIIKFLTLFCSIFKHKISFNYLILAFHAAMRMTQRSHVWCIRRLNVHFIFFCLLCWACPAAPLLSAYLVNTGLWNSLTSLRINCWVTMSCKASTAYVRRLLWHSTWYLAKVVKRIRTCNSVLLTRGWSVWHLNKDVLLILIAILFSCQKVFSETGRG